MKHEIGIAFAVALFVIAIFVPEPHRLRCIAAGLAFWAATQIG